MSLINISISLDRIDKTRITTGKDGKKYLAITVAKSKETDKFGNTHSVYHTPSKEEREAKANKVFCGNGKEVTFNKPNAGIPVHSSSHTTNGGTGYPTPPPPPGTVHPHTQQEIDSLPF